MTPINNNLNTPNNTTNTTNLTNNTTQITISTNSGKQPTIAQKLFMDNSA